MQASGGRPFAGEVFTEYLLLDQVNAASALFHKIPFSDVCYICMITVSRVAEGVSWRQTCPVR
jgi:hypothetical protein